MQPFEIIKVRLQTQPQDAKVYNGIIDCLTKIIKNEGPLALYKGDIFLMQGRLLLWLEWVFWVQYDSVYLKTSKNL